MTRRVLRPLLAAALLGLALTAPAPAAAAAGPPPAPLAKTDYWEGFTEFWTGRLKRTDGVVLLALTVGAVSLFIITRTRWRK